MLYEIQIVQVLCIFSSQQTGPFVFSEGLVLKEAKPSLLYPHQELALSYCGLNAALYTHSQLIRSLKPPQDCPSAGKTKELIWGWISRCFVK